MTTYAMFLADEARQLQNLPDSEESCACDVFAADIEDESDPSSYVAVAIGTAAYEAAKMRARELAQADVDPHTKLLWEQKYKPIYIKAKAIWKMYERSGCDYYFDLREYEQLTQAHPALNSADFSSCEQIDDAVGQLDDAMRILHEIMEVIQSEYNIN